MGFFDDDVPLTYAIDGTGRYVNVDEVPNGDACACVCPACGKPLSAIQGDTYVHHFRHKGEHSCKWALDTVLQKQTQAILLESKVVEFPALDYFDHVKGERCQLTKSIPMPVMDVREHVMANWRVPTTAFSVECKTGIKPVALIVWAAHEPGTEQIDSLVRDGFDVVSANIQRLHKWLKNSEGRHANRKRILARIQSKEFLKQILFGDLAYIMEWKHNAKADAKEVASKEEARRQAEEEAELLRKMREREEAIAAGKCPDCGSALGKLPNETQGVRSFPCSNESCGHVFTIACQHEWEPVVRRVSYPAEDVVLYAPENRGDVAFWGCRSERWDLWENLDDLVARCKGCRKRHLNRCDGIEAVGRDKRPLKDVKVSTIIVVEEVRETVGTGEEICHLCGATRRV